METIVVSHHRTQYCGRNRSQFPDRYGSSPSIGFKDINCRTFQSGGAILLSSSAYGSPTTPKRRPSSERLPIPSPENVEKQDGGIRSSAIPIRPSPTARGMSFSEDLSPSELWAGPAYSNSPPPSSLPMPKFSLRQRRSISLEIPATLADVNVCTAAKSAPSSPTRESFFGKGFSDSTVSATENLRRILHLDL